MKTILYLLLLLISAPSFAQECVNNPKEGQICLGAKNLPSVVEASDQTGRKMSLEFSKQNMLDCQVKLSGFKPNESYDGSVMTFGETKSFSGQVSSQGEAHFPITFSPESKVRCSCISPSSFIKIHSESEKKPLQIMINWDK